ncbi:MAG: hypothetical protein IJA18_04775, partial [Ruminococcus sp.]|nr:hypothetical protein [Ruminococcus sp.]
MENEKSVMFGHNLLDEDYEGVVYEMTHLQKGSFITKDSFYMHTEGSINDRVFLRDGSMGDVNDPRYVELIEKAKKALADSQTLLNNNEILLK